MNFVHLHVHSNYSFCRGANTIDQICAAAKEHNFSHIALTDTNGLYGLGWFLQIARSYGLAPLIGAYLDKEGQHAVVLAQNMSGYQFLVQTISKIHRQKNFRLAQWLASKKHDVVVLSDDLVLLQALIAAQATKDVFVEVIPYQNREQTLLFARENNLPIVAANAAYFISKKDYKIHKMLRAIDLNTTLQRMPVSEIANEEALFCSAEIMEKAFPNHPDALQNSVKIAQACAFDLDFKRYIFPAFTGPNGMNADAFLLKKVEEGLQWRYGSITDKVRRRLDYEMNIITAKGFAPYFLVVSDIVSKAPRTCGRGSAAASLVSYALGITHVDPIKYDLFFDRFLNQGRVDPPDIDVDFPWDERDDIIDYIFKTYGQGKVAMIANHNSFKARSAVREIAKVYGMQDSEISAITKKMTSYWQPDSIWRLTQTHPIFQGAEFPYPWPEIISMAEQIRGFPRHLSIHCGGVVIAPDGLDNYVPVQPAKKALKLTGALNAASKGLPRGIEPEKLYVVQWEKDQSEEMKLVKMDILGNRSLAVIRDALQAIKVNYNISINYAKWNPLADIKTQELLKRGDTIGVFYVESPAMRLLQQKTGKGDFEHLVIHSSIIRPAANSFINEYIRRLHGGSYEPLHPLLDNILHETFGIMVYQEDVSKVVMALADFTPAEADDLRKVLSKKHKEKKVADYKMRFFQGVANKNIDERVAQKTWDMIMSFSGYSFCKPHSASYALVSFKSAYLKAYYPAEFIAGVITNQGGYYSTFAYISEARRMGLQVLMPDINYSMREYVGVSRAVRVGFMQLKGIDKKTVAKIISERQKAGIFHSLDEFLERVPIDFADIAILIKAGCMDSLEPNKTRPRLLWQARLFLNDNNPIVIGQTMSLFEEKPTTVLPDIGNYDESTVLEHEIQTLGFLLSQHPLSLYQKKLENITHVKGKDLGKYVNKEVRTIGWFVTGKVTSTKKQDLMQFTSFEDTTAIYETTFFPETFSKFVHMISNEKPYILEGHIDCHFNAVTLTVQNVRFL